MKTILFLICCIIMCSCSTDKNKELRREYINEVATYKALINNQETRKVEYLDSIHKYTMLLNSL